MAQCVPRLHDVRDVLREVRASVGEIDESMRANMGGGLPIAGWRELVDGREVRVTGFAANDDD